MKIIAPTNCPECESILVRVKDQLFCKSTECPAQNTKLLQKYCTKLKIKGFGPATLEKLGYTSLTELYNISEQELLSKGFGQKTATNLVEQVEASKNIEFSAFIAAVGIPLVGDTVGRKLSSVANHPEEINPNLAKFSGIGDKASHNLMHWVNSKWRNELWMLPINFVSTADVSTTEVLKVDTVGECCITGKLTDFKNRTDAAAYLAKHGWETKKSITKGVTVLICEDDTKKGSSSYKKALAKGIKITTIKDLIG